MSDHDLMWDEVNRDYAAEETERISSLARQVVLPVWPYISASASVNDFENRRALIAARLDEASDALAGDNAAQRTAIRLEADRQMTEDFEALHAHREREAEAARVVAARRVQTEANWKTVVVEADSLNAAVEKVKAEHDDVGTIGQQRKLGDGKKIEVKYLPKTSARRVAVTLDEIHAGRGEWHDMTWRDSEGQERSGRMMPRHERNDGTYRFTEGGGMGMEYFIRPEDVVSIKRSAARTAAEGSNLSCDMTHDCDKPVTHIDEDGFTYCAQHGEQRKAGGWKRCRKLKGGELRALEGGGTISYSSLHTAADEKKPPKITDPQSTWTLNPNDEQWIGHFTDDALNANEKFWSSEEGRNAQPYLPGYHDTMLEHVRNEKARRKKGSLHTAQYHVHDNKGDHVGVMQTPEEAAKYIAERGNGIYSGEEEALARLLREGNPVGSSGGSAHHIDYEHCPHCQAGRNGRTGARTAAGGYPYGEDSPKTFLAQAMNHAKRNGHNMGEWESKSFDNTDMEPGKISEYHHAQCQDCGAHLEVTGQPKAGGWTYSGGATNKGTCPARRTGSRHPFVREGARPTDPNWHWKNYIGKGYLGFPNSEITEVIPGSDYMTGGPVHGEAFGTTVVRTEDGRELRIPGDMFMLEQKTYDRKTAAARDDTKSRPGDVPKNPDAFFDRESYEDSLEHAHKNKPSWLAAHAYREEYRYDVKPHPSGGFAAHLYRDGQHVGGGTLPYSTETAAHDAGRYMVNSERQKSMPRAARRTASLNDDMEMEHVIEVKPDGTVVDAPRSIYAPELDEGELQPGSGWELMNGYSGQDRYAGPIMHDSEYIGGQMERDILAQPGYYVAIPAYYTDEDDPEGEMIGEGWAVAYKPSPHTGMLRTAVRPECRFCGARVKEFGDICKNCEGSEENEVEKADRRALEDRQSMLHLAYTPNRTCEQCHGSGRELGGAPCPACGGQGWISGAERERRGEGRQSMLHAAGLNDPAGQSWVYHEGGEPERTRLDRAVMDAGGHVSSQRWANGHIHEYSSVADDTIRGMGYRPQSGKFPGNSRGIPLNKVKQLMREGSVLHTAPGGGVHAPYHIRQRGGKFVVVNDNGEVKGTHGSKEEAREQQKALYANVEGASEMAERKHESSLRRVATQTWADGYGVWHARASSEDEALQAILAELTERAGPNFAPESVGVKQIADGEWVEIDPLEDEAVEEYFAGRDNPFESMLHQSAIPRYELRHPEYGRGNRYNDLTRARKELEKAVPRQDWHIYDRHEKRVVGEDEAPQRTSSLHVATSAAWPDDVLDDEYKNWQAVQHAYHDDPNARDHAAGQLAALEREYASRGRTPPNPLFSHGARDDKDKDKHIPIGYWGDLHDDDDDEKPRGAGNVLAVSAAQLLAAGEDDVKNEWVQQGFEQGGQPRTTKPRQKPRPPKPEEGAGVQQTTLAAYNSQGEDDDPDEQRGGPWRSGEGDYPMADEVYDLTHPSNDDEWSDQDYQDEDDDGRRHGVRRRGPIRRVFDRLRGREAAQQAGYYVVNGRAEVAGPFATPSEAQAAVRPNSRDAVQFKTPATDESGYAERFMNPSGYSRGGEASNAERSMWSGAMYAKLREITAGVLATNPGMSPVEAQNIAIDTLERYPVMMATAAEEPKHDETTCEVCKRDMADYGHITPEDHDIDPIKKESMRRRASENPHVP